MAITLALCQSTNPQDELEAGKLLQTCPAYVFRLFRLIVSIFAFHGPGGSWRTTWSQGTAEDSMFWLQDLLPHEFPNCAIYSVGHEDQPFEFDGPAETRDFIYQEIKSHLNSTPLDERAPIVFVAHSLGGVSLKRVRTHVDHS